MNHYEKSEGGAWIDASSALAIDSGNGQTITPADMHGVPLFSSLALALGGANAGGVADVS